MSSELYVVLQKDLAENEKYYLIFEEACLVLGEKKPKKGVRIDPSDIPEFAKEWYATCLATIAAEKLKSEEAEMLRDAKAFYERFKKELELEAEKIKGAEEVER